MKIEISDEELFDLEVAVTGAVNVVSLFNMVAMFVPKKDFPFDKSEVQKELLYLAKASAFVERVKREKRETK